MDNTQNAVIVDLRTLVGTANLFSKQNMYRALWTGDSVSTIHETLTCKKEITGDISLLVITTNSPVLLSYIQDEQEINIVVNKMLVLDSYITDVSLTPIEEKAVVTCNLVFENSACGIVGTAIVGIDSVC